MKTRTLSQNLHLALELAQRYSSGKGGMASVRIAWHPYQSGWIATADYSSGFKFESSICEQPEQALEQLITKLQDKRVDMGSRADCVKHLGGPHMGGA